MPAKKWYAVYTRPRWEKKVAAILTKKKVENYCPLNRIRKQWTDRAKIVFEPLFPSYVFVQVADDEHIDLLRTDGVFSMVYWLGKPAVIKDAEIEAIRRFLGEHQNVRLESIKVNVDDHVRILSGPLMEREGIILEVSQNRVKVVLPSLGYNMVADITISNIEKLTPELSQSKSRTYRRSHTDIDV